MTIPIFFKCIRDVIQVEQKCYACCKNKHKYTRASKKGRPINIGKSTTVRNTSTSDAIRIWNLAPDRVTESKAMYQVKSQIKTYVKTLPV